MNVKSFTPSMTGRLVPVSAVEGATHAFVPNPLPANWQWPSRLWPLLLEARIALARLDGVGRHLPDPPILIHPLQYREAQKSSSLEGTFTEPQQQLLFQIAPVYPRSDDDPVNAYREVFNYSAALRYHLEHREDLPLSLRLIRGFHRILMDGVRRVQGEPGEFRRTQNQIGRPPRYVPPPPNDLPQCLDAFEKYLHADRQPDPLVDAFVAHYQFEAIHPFGDGNGRVGRLLLAVCIMDWCGLSSQWLYMSAFFEKHRDQYIDRLFAVSASGAWEPWLEFCLRGVVEEARDTERRCDRLLSISRTFGERITKVGGSFRLQQIAEGLLVLPVVRIPQIASKFGVTYPTAKADIDRLVSAGILREIEATSPRTFCAPEIMDITYSELE